MQQRFKHLFVLNSINRLVLHPMKIFTFILAVIVLTLSCMPCADAAATGMKSKLEIKKSLNNERQQSDFCSPFCICSCCAGFSINHTIPNIENLSKLHKINYTLSYYQAVIKISLPVWQPPKL